METEQRITGTTLKCQHCRYVWVYKGKSKYIATCPRCVYRVTLKSHKTTEKPTRITENNNVTQEEQ